ncbi:MAG: zinc ribbon domain-containing protein, partial [Deltaproteobacteria bacterium]
RPRGARLSLQVELPPALDDPNALSISQARVFFEHDAAMLRVREEIHLRVEGDAPLVGTNEAPLVQFPIPRGATGLRFGPDTLRMGLEARAGGGLLFLGPIKPGASTVNLGYDLPVPDGTALWERSFGLEIPVLMLLIADTGLVVESDRLHRRRSVRTPDLSYMVAEGFRIGAEETVSLGLRPLEARPGVRLSTAGVLVWSVGLLTAGLVLTPLRRREGGSADEAVGAEAALQREREALYASIRDLDHDHEVGKVTESDYLALRAPLRARAVALLRAEREAPQVAAARSVEDEAVAGACPDCGAQRGAADRFCSQCGLRLDANPAVESGTRG